MVYMTCPAPLPESIAWATADDVIVGCVVSNTVIKRFWEMAFDPSEINNVTSRDALVGKMCYICQYKNTPVTRYD